jgi:imidazolonepropionase-like amidohydrolase
VREAPISSGFYTFAGRERTVGSRGDEIVGVGATADLAVPPGAQTIDGAGRFLIPG